MMRKGISEIINAISAPPAQAGRKPMHESITNRGTGGRNLKKMLEAPDPNTTIAPVIEPEPTVGREMPVGIYQCSVCKVFSTDGQTQNPCPTCGTSGSYSRVGDVVPTGDPGMAQMTVDAQADINEALSLLNKGATKKFAESYGNRTKINKRGALELSYTKGSRSTMVESVMNLRQKSAYDMAMKLIESATKVDQTPSKLQEFIEGKSRAHRTSRAGLRIITEMSSLMTDVTRQLERMGVKYDHKKFTEALDGKVKGRITKLTEDVAQLMVDNAYVYTPSTEMGEAQYSEAARRVIDENGLEVVSAETTFDGDAAQVRIRIQDNDNTTIDLADVADVLAQEYEADVVVLAQEVPGDSSMTDVTLVVNETATQPASAEGTHNDDLSESLSITEKVAKHNKRIAESVIASSSDKSESDPLGECGPKKRKDESVGKTGRRVVRRAQESVSANEAIEIDEDTRYFVLSTESPDDDPSVLAYDGALVSLSDVNAEDTAAVFNDVESAQAFIEENNLVGSCRVVSGSIVASDDLDESGSAVMESFQPTAKSGRKLRSRRGGSGKA